LQSLTKGEGRGEDEKFRVIHGALADFFKEVMYDPISEG
jgi:hypothetical protein